MKLISALATFLPPDPNRSQNASQVDLSSTIWVDLDSMSCEGCRAGAGQEEREGWNEGIQNIERDKTNYVLKINYILYKMMSKISRWLTYGHFYV